MKKLLCLTLCVLMLISLCACSKTVSTGTATGNGDTNNESINENQGENSTVNYEAKDTTKLIDIGEIKAPGKEKADKAYQEREPKDGDMIAILHTSFGDISMRFLEEAAPLACASFIALAKEGRYDNTIFHRVINNFMIQGGDYTNYNGTGGESAFGEEFDLEIAEGIGNIEGSVAMANRGPGTNGSQFYINQIDNAYLDGNYTVFAQVFDGMDVVNDIAVTNTDSSDKPLVDVVLQSIDIEEYK